MPKSSLSIVHSFRYLSWLLYMSSMAVCLISLTACGVDNSPAQASDYPEYTSERASLYLSKCSLCHAAPLPSSHTAVIWPRVVERMQIRMIDKSIPPLDQQELQIIEGYLQQFAKQ